MKLLGHSCPGLFSPSGSFEAVPRTLVQHTLQQWFEQWGRPAAIQFDHGQPWKAANSDLPTLFELWLVGLGIEVHWSRPRHPQDNGIIERSHRTLQAWSAPGHCQTLEEFQQRLDEAIRIQRECFPTDNGLPRGQRYPDLYHVKRPYCRDDEANLWSLDAVHQFLAEQCWQRRVDDSGRISLYNHNYLLHRQWAGYTVWVYFEPATAQWLCCDEQGHWVGEVDSREISATGIRQLKLNRSQAKSAAKGG